MRNTGTLLFLVVSAGLAIAGWHYVQLPTVYERYPSGEIVCALDADGNEIPLESIEGRYHHDYAETCPSANK